MQNFSNLIYQNKTEHTKTKLVSGIKKTHVNFQLVKAFKNFGDFNQRNLRKSACSAKSFVKNKITELTFVYYVFVSYTRLILRVTIKLNNSKFLFTSFALLHIPSKFQRSQHVFHVIIKKAF